ncbi:hypothetical protein AYX22_14900 [Arthrobacter sp. D5-1]|nr:hypothetical protein AYX22_14900 [Arthrobacter sp. D5-1]
MLPFRIMTKMVVTWKFSPSESDDLRKTDSSSAIVDLRPDGTASIQDFPADGFSDSVIFGEGRSTTGRWEIVPQLDKYSGAQGHPGIQLSLINPASPTNTLTGVNLVVVGDEKDFRIMIKLSEISEVSIRYVLRRD